MFGTRLIPALKAPSKGLKTCSALPSATTVKTTIYSAGKPSLKGQPFWLTDNQEPGMPQ